MQLNETMGSESIDLLANQLTLTPLAPLARLFAFVLMLDPDGMRIRRLRIALHRRICRREHPLRVVLPEPHM